MPDGQQQQFDGENPVSGYTLFHGKDGKSYYLKGENLSDADVMARVQKLRGTQTDINTQAKEYGTRPLTVNLPKVIMPLPGESFEETMKRGIKAGKEILKDQNKLRMANVQAEGQGIADAPLVLGAASLPGIAAYPLATATGIAGGYLAGALGRGAANVFDASPATAENMEGAGNLLGGLAGGIFGPQALRTTGRVAGNRLAEVLRNPATARQSQLGRPGSVKDILPPQLQRWTLPPWMIPKGEVGTPTNPGPFSEIPVRMPKAEPPLGSPENPGLFSKIPTGKSSMPKMASPLPPSPFENATPTNIQIGNAELPPVSGNVPVPFPEIQKAGAPSVPRIVSPSAAEPRFSGSEGRAATWTNEDVMRLAQEGNREAIQQVIRRGMQLPPGARYVMGDPDFSRTVYNPRESTSFTPEGTPIRNMEGRPSSSRQRIVLTDPFSPASSKVPQGNPNPFSPQDIAYRTHTTGTPEIDLAAHAHATASPEEAASYLGHREAGVNQTVSRIDLSRFKPGEVEVMEGPNGSKWYKFNRPLTSADYLDE